MVWRKTKIITVTASTVRTIRKTKINCRKLLLKKKKYRVKIRTKNKKKNKTSKIKS